MSLGSHPWTGSSPAAAKLIASALSHLAATSKECGCRVGVPQKRLTTVRPRRGGRLPDPAGRRRARGELRGRRPGTSSASLNGGSGQRARWAGARCTRRPPSGRRSPEIADRVGVVPVPVGVTTDPLDQQVTFLPTKSAQISSSGTQSRQDPARLRAMMSLKRVRPADGAAENLTSSANGRAPRSRRAGLTGRERREAVRGVMASRRAGGVGTAALKSVIGTWMVSGGYGQPGYARRGRAAFPRWQHGPGPGSRVAEG